jgi:hypothetical protein
LLDLADVLGDLRRGRGIDPEGLIAHERFAGQFEEDARVRGLIGRHEQGLLIGFRGSGFRGSEVRVPRFGFGGSGFRGSRTLEPEPLNPNLGTSEPGT